MKQFWTGIGILAILLVAGLWLGDAIEDIHIRQVIVFQQHPFPFFAAVSGYQYTTVFRFKQDA